MFVNALELLSGNKLIQSDEYMRVRVTSKGREYLSTLKMNSVKAEPGI